jgi:orotidine 5'-phosphate decarboxylase subfamily 2
MTTAIATSFAARTRAAAQRNGSLLCVGLDPDLRRFPASLRSRFEHDPVGALTEFNRAIIGSTADLVCAYKPNLGFYMAYGLPGLEALLRTRELIPADIPVILDAKVNDIGHTATAYAAGYFDQFNMDVVTLSPYLGTDSLRPFLARPDRGVLILCRTSNPSAGDMQDLPVAQSETSDQSIPLYEAVAHQIAAWITDLDAAGAIGAVTGATYPDQLAVVRRILPDAPLLIPGVGAQEGDLAATVRAGLDAGGFGAIVNASRSVTYASSDDDYAPVARAAAIALCDEIERARATR